MSDEGAGEVLDELDEEALRVLSELVLPKGLNLEKPEHRAAVLAQLAPKGERGPALVARAREMQQALQKVVDLVSERYLDLRQPAHFKKVRQQLDGFEPRDVELFRLALEQLDLDFDFTIEEEITKGEGGLAKVYSAIDVALQRKVAIKKPRSGATDDPARFRNEALMAAGLHHENIVPVHRFQSALVDDQLGPSEWLVMELIGDGRKSLKAVLDERNGRRPKKEELPAIVLMIAKMADALAHAHRNGIIHRDVKPANIFLAKKKARRGFPESEEPMLGDFGIARLVEGPDDPVSNGTRPPIQAGLTAPGTQLMTELYASPEQLRGEALDAATDIYSLGLVLYEAITGTLPFADPKDRLTKIPERPRRLNPNVDRRLDAICMRCLSLDRDARYSKKAQDLEADLRLWLEHRPVEALPRTGLLTLAGLYIKREPYGAVAVGATVVIMLLLLLGGLQEQKHADDLAAELYVSSISLAEREVAANQMLEAKHRLEGEDSCPKKLRGWEWNYLERRMEAEPIVLTEKTRDGQPAKAGALLGSAYSPDRTRLATVGNKGVLTIWDPHTGEKKGQVAAKVAPDAADNVPLRAVTYSADGNVIIAVGGGERANSQPYGRIFAWDAATLERKPLPPALGLNLWSVAVSADGRFLAVGGGGLGPSGDGALTIYEIADGPWALRFLWGEERKSRAFAVAFDPSSHWIAVGSEVTTVSVFDVDHKAKFELGDPGGTPLLVRGLAFSRKGPDGTLLAAAAGALTKGDTGRITIWRLEDRAEVMRSDARTGEHADEASAVAFNDAGDRLASGSHDRTVKIWDVHLRRVVLTLRGHKDIVRGVAFSSDSQMLASVGEDGRAFVWDAGPPPPPLPCATVATDLGRIWDARVSSDGKTLAAIGEQTVTDPDGAKVQNVLALWDMADLTVPPRIATHDGQLRALALAPGGDRLDTASYDGLIERWTRAGQPKGSDLGERKNAWRSALAVSPDGALLAAGHDYDIEVWTSNEEGKAPKLVGRHHWVVGSLAFSPVREIPLLASGSWDQTARLWTPTASGPWKEQPLEGHEGRVNAVAFSPDARLLGTASNDTTVGLWDVATHTLRATLSGHTDVVLGVAFSPNDDLLASISRDQTVRLWNAHSGELLKTMRGYAARLRNVSFAPDGRLVIVSGDPTPGSGRIELCQIPSAPDAGPRLATPSPAPTLPPHGAREQGGRPAGQ